MRSATSCFNLTLYQKNLSRFWPIWALYGLIWLFLLPISILNESRWWDSARAAQRPLQFLEGGSAGLAMALIFGLLSAMAVFSYLYNSRSVGLMHTLPLKREGLFLTNYLSGLSCFLLPNLAVFVLSLAAEALAGAVNAGSLCMWLTVQSLLCFFFYSFAVFCAMFTGHILALPAFYGILNILAAGLAYLFDALAGAFVYGYAGIPRLSEAAVWLSPALRLTYTLNLIYPGGNGVYVQFYGLHVVLLYALAGLILTGLALLVYRRRSLERAGDIVSVGWVRPVFKYGVGACAAVALGSFLYGMFLYSLPENAWTLLSFLLLCGAAGYFVAEMLLRKRFWVFRRSWKGCLVLLGCLTALVCVLEFDLTGFERRVPGSDQVASVQIGDVRSAPYDDLNYTSLNLSDPADLALVEQLHRAIVAEKDRFDQADDYGAVQLTAGVQGIIQQVGLRLAGLYPEHRRARPPALLLASHRGRPDRSLLRRQPAYPAAQRPHAGGTGLFPPLERERPAGGRLGLQSAKSPARERRLRGLLRGRLRGQRRPGGAVDRGAQRPGRRAPRGALPVGRPGAAGELLPQRPVSGLPDPRRPERGAKQHGRTRRGDGVRRQRRLHHASKERRGNSGRAGEIRRRGRRLPAGHSRGALPDGGGRGGF